jgi:hypothetical protein
MSQKLEVTNSSKEVTISLDGNTAVITAGGSGIPGAIVVKDGNDNELMRVGMVHVGGIQGLVSPIHPQFVLSVNGEQRIKMDASNASGQMTLQNGSGVNRINLDGGTGVIRVRSDAGAVIFKVDGDTGNIFLGGGETAGHLFVNNKSGQDTIHLDGGKADLYMGGREQAGNLFVNNKDGQDTIHLDGGKADLYMGGHEQAGNLFVNNKDGANTIGLDGQGGVITVRGSGQNDRIHLNGFLGQISVHNVEGKEVFRFKSYNAVLDIFGSGGIISLDGSKGDISLENADCAEEFEISGSEVLESGTVLVLGQDGKLQKSRDAYDKKVVGVISGAGDCKPGIVLDRKAARDDRMPVALMGKVFCKADAQYSPIEVGDLLTTSPTAGHAMKATDPLKAFGAVIGKALRPLSEGRGLVPVLIALQ